ncbi:hypothetical protein H6F89_18380 [Cyanobacteria bacterium FACHB-63]|nr:hypothetical protein [Cyanobacteria bacterium FACHB-63]
MNDSPQALMSKFAHSTDASQERLRMVLFGAAGWIVQTMHQLHNLGFADVGDSRPLLPAPDGELLSILTRYRG